MNEIDDGRLCTGHLHLPADQISHCSRCTLVRHMHKINARSLPHLTDQVIEGAVTGRTDVDFLVVASRARSNSATFLAGNAGLATST